MDFFEEIHQKLKQEKAGTYIQHSQLPRPLPMHNHPTDQFIFVQKGVAHLITEENQYYIPAHNFIWVPAQTPHRISFFQQQVWLKTIYYPRNIQADFYDRIGIYPLTELLHQMLQFTDQWNGLFLSSDWQTRYLQTVKDLLPEISLDVVLLYLPTTEHPRIKNLIQYMEENLDGDLSVPTVSQVMGSSVRNFSRIFSKQMGMTYINYLKTFRIVKSIEILMQEDVSVSEAAYRVGYSSLSVFSHTFWQLVGENPKSFQKKFSLSEI